MMQPERSFQGFGSRFRQNSFPYDVKRDVYNEENFQQEHRRKTASSGNVDIDITTFSHHVQCSCSWHKFRRCMLTVFPFLEWMCFYRFKDWLLGDLLAGISVGLVQLPQGSFFLVSALMINVLRIYPFNSGRLVLGTFIRDDFSNLSFFEGYNKSLSVVASTTLLTGIIQLSMGMLGFGFIVTYLPEAVISAYLAATALHIMLSQLTCIFGIMISFNSGPVSFVYNIINYCIGLPKANSTSILLFLTAVVALRINRCIRISVNQYPIEFPMEVFLILGFTAFASKINMATENSKMLIDMIPYSFLFPETPDLSMLTAVILESFSLAVVSSSLLVFLGRKIAIFHNYDVNSNQDLIAIGLCNVVSSFFRSYVFTGAVIRTVIQDKSGGRQQFASLVGAGVMLLLMVKVGRFFYELPNAVLAGIVLSNALPYLETVYNLPNLWRQNQYDCIAWMVTFISAIFLGLDVGLLVSVAFTFFIITVQSHRYFVLGNRKLAIARQGNFDLKANAFTFRTKILLLGQIPNTNIYRSIHDYREVTNIPGVKIFQCCNSITFVNVYYLKHKLLSEIEMVRVPLTEEEVYALFSQSEDGSQQQKICRCFCNCDELEPRPRVVYTERFESKRDKYSSSINLIRCSRFESMNTNQSMSDEQVPYTTSSISQENPIPNYEDVEKVWPSDNSSRLFSTLPEASESQVRDRPPMPYLASSLQPLIHTIILDFSMVHLVDSQASVVLRQMCNAFQNANILVLIAGCHSSVVRAFEKNDFFDASITKAQLFLTLHDAVLFALSRKLPEPSELSMDESETVIQETHSETDKNGESRHKMSSSFIEIPKNKSPGFSTLQDPVREEESELDLELDRILESEQEPGLDLDLDLDHEMEPESELEPESEMDPETEPEPELESRPRAQTYPQQQYWPLYQSLAPNSAPQT
ncbi:testis anion transporter 1 isoform X1 [Camelus ferus]|uniref:Testis anion transporter 1 isoform X1 n=3 Tax=Camelus TaxID=9836 RepID=A0A8B8RLJ7_CAMFR|nr:testis anion transporter 1 isoform X1 [Camelus dromedarius]XP_032318813.1 testis anion transporter 1 isoform X1 [Camelus ferus]XP_032318814.1 testis anion transporter 1 isoform X1 [Camelus ferus]XP_032318815.1 testis anion transporter 1 isoform X1 [Camelus ferus]